MNRRRLQWKYWRDLFRRPKVDRDLNEELRAHLALEVDRRIAAGESPEEARTNALRDLRSMSFVQEATRDVRFWVGMERWIKTFRYSARILAKTPGFTLVAVVTLALGVGANTAIFSVADPILIRKLPVERPEELVVFGMSDSEYADVVPYELFEQMANESTAFSDVFAHTSRATAREVSMAVEGESTGTPVRATYASGTYFSMLGVHAVAGRVFGTSDDQRTADPVAVISYGLWRRLFAESTDTVGKTITLAQPPMGDRRFTVVGVAPPEFRGINADFDPDLWLPYQQIPGIELFVPGRFSASMMGRLNTGVSINQAQAEVAVAFDRVAPLLAESWGNEPRVRLYPGASGYSRLRSEYWRPLAVLGVSTTLVLLVTCTNLASLLLARGTGRRREIAVRVAMGGGRLNVMGQLLAEGLILAAVGGAASVLVAHWGARLLVGYLPADSGFAPGTGLDFRILAFTGAASLVSVLVFALFPALVTSRVDPNSVLQEQAGFNQTAYRTARLNRVVMAGQIAFSLLLLVGAGLFVGTLENLKSLETGFDQDDVVQFRVETPDITSGDIGERLFPALDSVPGVESATYYHFGGFLDGTPDFVPMEVEGVLPGSDENLEAVVFEVGPRFFETMGIPVVAGRDFTYSDQEREPSPAFTRRGGEPDSRLPVGIISSNLAESLFGNRDPIGRTVRDDRDQIEIVGVAGDIRHGILREPPPRILYRMLRTGPRTYASTYAVRTETATSALTRLIQAQVDEIDETNYVARIQSIRDLVESTFEQERLTARLAGIFGLLALSLASTGIYGLIAYSVAERRGEIGIRLALGARQSNVVEMVFRETGRILLTGVLVGLAVALATTRLVSALLFGLTPTDPATIASAIGVLVAAALTAAAIPAWKASRIDPMRALRHD